MNKTKIDWCDMTWNPVTGCLHDCPYCYARKIAQRFNGNSYGAIGIDMTQYGDTQNMHKLEDPHETCHPNHHWRRATFPFGFDPTFHRYRLNEPKEINKPKNIFVCSMADLFGSWVPEEWIKEVFKACEAAPQHNYLFLTKNPDRYIELYEKKLFPYKENYWFGTTVTKNADRFVWIHGTPYKCFLSIEPLMEPLESLYKISNFNWVIIGAETGNRKERIIPKREWIEEIAFECKKANIPIFMKESLRGIMGKDMIQEYPEGMK